MNSPYELVRLANGAFSVRSTTVGETFHPVVGPVAEADTLYVRQLHLAARIQAHSGEFIIWDVGLGAAANAIAVLRSTRHLQGRFRLLSFDRTLEPLQFALAHADKLGYLDGYDHSVADLLKHGRALDGQWQVRVGEFPEWLRQEPFSAPPPNAILFDPFSPARNPAMWTASLFADLFRRLEPSQPCALSTYSRSTMLRVTLLLAGFYVGVGHATGEKEETTIAANNLSLIDDPLPQAWLRRAAASKSAEPLRDPIIYRQQPLSRESWDLLCAHPQFTL